MDGCFPVQEVTSRRTAFVREVTVPLGTVGPYGSLGLPEALRALFLISEVGVFPVGEADPHGAKAAWSVLLPLGLVEVQTVSEQSVPDI